MKPFVLLQTRPEDAAADNEYEAFMKFSGLEPDQLHRFRIETGEMPNLKLDNYSGVFLGGGPFNSNEPDSSKSVQQKSMEAGINRLLDNVVEADFPFLAACYIGLIVKHQKGVVSRKYTEVIAGYEMTMTEAGQSDKLLAGLPRTFTAFSGHKESCEVLPLAAVNLVSSPTCPVEMFRLKNNVYALQFHPELDVEGLALRVQIYKNHEYFKPEEARPIIDEAKRCQVTEPVKILRKFVELYNQVAA